jgi:hypothetical protein
MIGAIFAALGLGAVALGIFLCVRTRPDSLI